jgi:hypothetical protein
MNFAGTRQAVPTEGGRKASTNTIPVTSTEMDSAIAGSSVPAPL